MSLRVEAQVLTLVVEYGALPLIRDTGPLEASAS